MYQDNGLAMISTEMVTEITEKRSVGTVKGRAAVFPSYARKVITPSLTMYFISTISYRRIALGYA